MTIRHPCIKRAALAAASAAALAAVAPSALAQQAPSPTPTGAQASQVGEVVVTGSRIARRDYVAESPIVTVPQQALQNLSPSTLDEALGKELPQVTGISGQTQTGAGFGQTGAATLNLRNLGPSRNLVLLDGRRMQPSTTGFAVDINSIPSALVDSVEVITGGASAVYGSDAVAGVVNFKLKHNFEGLEIDAKGGIAGRGDYGNTDDSVTAGANFADGRGNVVISLDYLYRAATLQRDIPFYQRELAAGSGSFALSFLDLGYYQSELDTIPGTPVPNWPGFPAAGPVDYGINSDRTSLFNIATGAGYTSGYYPTNPNYAFSNGVKYNTNYNETATTPMQRYSGFARFEYKIADNVSAYGQLIYSHYNVDNVYIPLPAANFWSIPIPFDAAHPVPASLLTELLARPDPVAPWHYSTSISFLGIPTTRNTSDVYQALVGVKGTIGSSGWTWDIDASHGSTSVDSVGEQGYVDWRRWEELLLAPNYGANFNNGAGACTSGISPFINPASISQDCRSYLQYQYHNSLDQSQDIVEANLQGKLFDLPAGELRVAVGANYRRNSLDSLVDPIYQTNPQIGVGTGASSMVGTFSANSSSGASHVYELYGEALVPILRDLPFAKSLDLDLAYRYSNYALSGGVSTYKASADWRITNAFMLRGGYQRAVRAPNVTELFSSSQATIVIPAFDPCVNVGPFALPPGPYGNNAANPDQAKVKALCTALTPNAAPGLYNGFAGQGTPVIVGSLAGNANLKPEKADTFTFGAVFRPTGLPWGSTLSASVDYYNIKITDAVQALDPNQTYQLCFNAFGSNPTYSSSYAYCQIIARAPGNGLSAGVFDVYQNQGGIKTSGVDVQVDWRVPAGPGSLELNGVVNYLGDYKQSFLTGLPFVEFANTVSSTAAYFRWRPVLTATYTLDKLNAGLRWRFTPRTRDVSCASQCNAPDTPSYSTFDLFGSYDLTPKVRVSAGVDNLFDRDPPLVGGVLGNTNLGEYDVVGRQFYLALKARF